jgi:hypothetical protein
MNKGSIPWALVVFFACALTTAIALTGGAARADSGHDARGIDANQGMSLVEVTLPSKAASYVLEREDDSYGVEFNDHYLRYNDDGTVTVTVFGTEDGLLALAEAGYDLGRTIEGPSTWRARLAERQFDVKAEHHADAAALGDPVAAADHENEIVVLRVDYFENYAGRFLSVEAKTRLGHVEPDGTGYEGPTLSLSWNTGSGTPISSTPRTMDVNVDPDTTPDTYVEHRELVRIGERGSAAPPRPTLIRVGSSTGAMREAGVNTWLGGGLPPMSSGFMKDFTTRYMDPTEVYARFGQLAREFPNIAHLIPLPYKTNGYQRKAQATMSPAGSALTVASSAGATAIRVASTSGMSAGTQLIIDAGPNQEIRTVASTSSTQSPNPNITLTAALTQAHPVGASAYIRGSELGSGSTPASGASAVVLTSRAWGHEGGNDITVEFRNPGAVSAPLNVATVGKNILVNLGTDASGELSSTASEVVAAINGHPGASAEVVALTFRGHVGDGIVQPRSQVNLSDFLTTATNAHVPRGPFQYSVMRIGKVRDGSKVGVFLYCQQHAREWVTPITCLETAERLLRNYAIDPLTRELVDNLDIFILPSSNPDGSHYSLHNFASQRRNMTNWCVEGAEETDSPSAPEFWTPRINPATGAPYTNTDPGSRNAWGVDLNRNNTFGTLFDGYIGASTSCTSDVYTGPSEASEPEIRNELWIADTFSHIKFSNNIHSFGGYFMWAPGTYLPDRSEGAADHANIGVEKYFFEAGDRILNRIKEHRDTAILPERTGPIADVLYSAAGNSADEHWYNRGVIAYSFETGADRFVNTTLSAASAAGTTGIRLSNRAGFGEGDTIKVDAGTPNEEIRTVQSVAASNPPSPNPNVTLTTPLTLPHPAGAQVYGGTTQSAVGFFPDYTAEGKDEALEFANGNYGLLESALAYAQDNAAPQVEMTGPRASRTPIETTFRFVNEPSVIRYTMDGSTPTSSSPAWDSTGPREPGQVFPVSSTTTFRWLATDMKGNTSTGSARFAIDSTAPTTTATVDRSPGFATVTLTGNDNVAGGGSGIAETRYRTDGGSWQVYSGPFGVVGAGSHTVDYYSVDEAGNTETTKSVAFVVESGRAAVPCRLVLKPSRLRAKERTTVRVIVKLGGRGYEDARVALRGPGIARALRTDSQGVATARVRPSRAGTLRASVRANALTAGCRDSSRVLRARSRR